MSAAAAPAAGAGQSEGGREVAYDRYSSAEWHDLWLSQVLVNSFGKQHAPGFPDLLADPELAQPWLSGVLARWCAQHGLPDPGIVLDAAQLGRLRELRDEVQDLVAHGAGTSGGAGGPAGGVSAVDDGFGASISVHVGGGRVLASPEGAGADWVRGAVAMEWLLAHEHDTLRRLKLCHNPKCLSAFYDHSKNNSRVWHDLARCGNPANVRAYRARRAQGSGDAAAVRQGSGSAS